MMISVLLVLLLALACSQAQSGTAAEEDAAVDIPWFIWLVIVVVTVFLILLIWCTIYFTIYNIRIFCRLPNSRPGHSTTELKELNENASPDLHSIDWELDRRSIVLRGQLGIGEFGPIYDAELQLGVNMTSRTVVKVFQQGTSQDLVRFREEAEEIKHLQHPNVGRVLGLVTGHAPYYLVLELTVNGDLKTFLLAASHRPAPHHG
jgi:hypothetical protein